MCQYVRGKHAGQLRLPSNEGKGKHAGIFLKNRRVARRILERDRAPSPAEHAALSQLVRIQLLNQCAHEMRQEGVKLRKSVIVTKYETQERMEKNTADRRFLKKYKK